MSNKSLAILGVVAAVMVILAVVLSGLSGGPRKGSTGPAYLIQGLDPAGIGRIVIGSGDKVVTLSRRGNAFTVAEKSNYLADIKQVNDLIQKCADIKTTGSAHTSNPANHEDLEVTEDKGRSVVKFFTPDPNSRLITGLVVGKNIEPGQGAYVRMLPGDDVYVTTESPWIKDQATDYIDQELFSVKTEDINSVTVNPGGESYTLKAGSGDVVSLENLPAGKKLKNTDARSVLTALTSLRFDDVSRSIGGLAFNEQYTCRLNDLVVYALSIAQKDDKTYIVCEAEFTGERPSQVKENDSEEELKKKEALLFASDNVAEFAARHKGWIYEIPDWKAKNLTKKLSDLLEDLEKPKDPNAPEPAAQNLESPTEPEAAQPTESKPVEPAAPKAADPNIAPDGPKPDDPNAPDEPRP
ncbi:MAG TPA: DUF4340 domain-containing protein [Sedimentisphaerales bacterium]|nr:DUF4340 domain-containing protein [Sedimentisphaerales bacterium]